MYVHPGSPNTIFGLGLRILLAYPVHRSLMIRRKNSLYSITEAKKILPPGGTTYNFESWFPHVTWKTHFLKASCCRRNSSGLARVYRICRLQDLLYDDAGADGVTVIVSYLPVLGTRVHCADQDGSRKSVKTDFKSRITVNAAGNWK